ncbi:MAG: hypothetical protein DWC09_02060 [Candidatus Poseidoniales archaeon]|nr:MAG: hypothetical protein DWC09_02060 [Candidatus Poseidoniales archaeon]
MGSKVHYAMLMMVIMLVAPLTSMIEQPPQPKIELESEGESLHGIHSDLDFNTTDGFALTNVTIDASNGEAELSRPVLSWNTIANPSLMVPRTGGCAAYIEDTQSIYLMGGRSDPDPALSGDEETTRSVEKFTLENTSWEPVDSSMPVDQMYFDCAAIGTVIYSVGDYHPYATPEVRAEGLLQIYNTSNNTWYDGAFMPGNTGVGLSGVEDLGGFIYSAGGVSRKDRSDISNVTLRYNPQTDTWDQMANMNVGRHSFTLTEFKGKLYALGGIVRQYDPISGQYFIAPSNHTEVYDAQANTWTNHTDLPFDRAAHASTVFNGEILISGGLSSSGWGAQTREVHGYDPISETWSLHSDLPFDMYDHTITAINESVVYASGDSSSYRFSSWSSNYRDATGIHNNSETQAGWITSDIIDLRRNTNGVASPVRLEFDGSTLPGTELQLQYRLAEDSTDMSSTLWRPLGPENVSQFHLTGVHTLTDIGEGMSYIQYRIKMSTSKLIEWSTPDLNSIVILSEEATLLTPPLTSMHPNAAQVTIQSLHSSFGTESNYSLLLHQTNADGFNLPAEDSAKITWNNVTSSYTIDDQGGILRQSGVNVNVHSSSEQGDVMHWGLSVNEGLASQFLVMEIQTEGELSSTFRTDSAIEIQNILNIDIIDFSSEFSSMGDNTVSDFEVFPDGAEIEVTVDHSFNQSGTRLLLGTIEARLHIDIENPQSGWYNTTTNWEQLITGSETEMVFTVENVSSGNANIWIEARTQDNFVLDVDSSVKQIIVDVDAPVQTSITPQNDDYINENPERSVEFSFYDVGGFSTDTVQAYLWIEALHDADSDGEYSLSERVSNELYISNVENAWLLNLTVNDTANEDHQMVHVILEGTNLAGKNIRDTSLNSNSGLVSWMSRTPERANISSVEPLETQAENVVQRIEPTGTVGWKVVVSDSNALTDISEIRLILGKDESLGMRYSPTQNVCESMDARLMIENSCFAEVLNNSYSISFAASIDWALTESGLDIGHLEIQVDDYDGMETLELENQWTLDRELSIEFDSLMDIEGAVQGELETGSSIVTGDSIQVNATINHFTSNTSYNGPVSVFWRGKIQDQFFSESFSVQVVDGKLSATIQAPSGSGLWHQTVLEIWDPYNSEQFYSMELPNMLLDDSPPLLVDSTMTSGVSRYHLEAVEIGVNVDESISWSGNLTLQCKIRSLEFEWPTLTQTREPTTVFDGKTMFSFLFNFAEQGDPSTLSTQSSMDCWASGMDDAGLELYSPSGNSENSPWLSTSLSNIGPDLAIQTVNFEGSTSEGSKLRIAVGVVSLGETIETRFNVTLSIVQDGQSTIVGRELIPGMNENTEIVIRSTLEVPKGDWTLLIEIDAEQSIWELSEINNVWSKNYSQNKDDVSFATPAVAAGGGVLVLIALLVFARKRNRIEVDEVVPAKKKPLKGPPPKSKIENITSMQEVNAEGIETVESYAKLPGGGDYDYTGGQTIYSGEGIGTWKQNPDESFTRIE